MKKQGLYNVAYVDGQNLRLGTLSEGWKVDLYRLGVFLRDKFAVQEAYYYLGFVSDEEQELYKSIQKAGFILCFREHSSALKGNKKGNVDVDIVFAMMKQLYEESSSFDQFVLISGDGDYIKLVKHLIKHGRLKKILFPNRKYSSLYKKIKYSYGMNLSIPDVKKKIAYTKKGTS